MSITSVKKCTISIAPDTLPSKQLAVAFSNSCPYTCPKQSAPFPLEMLSNIRYNVTVRKDYGKGSIDNMITGELKNKIDGIWDIFWSSGMTTP